MRKEKPTLKPIPGSYKTRCGEWAVVESVGSNALNFGTIGLDPKDAIWDNQGKHRFKKYDLVERVV